MILWVRLPPRLMKARDGISRKVAGYGSPAGLLNRATCEGHMGSNPMPSAKEFASNCSLGLHQIFFLNHASQQILRWALSSELVEGRTTRSATGPGWKPDEQNDALRVRLPLLPLKNESFTENDDSI